VSIDFAKFFNFVRICLKLKGIGRFPLRKIDPLNDLLIHKTEKFPGFEQFLTAERDNQHRHVFGNTFGDTPPQG
jgi:hypothetical protein